MASTNSAIIEAITRPEWVQRLLAGLTQYPDDGCWEWSRGRDRNGYGQISTPGANSRKVATHRAVWTLIVGEIPEGMVLDHDGDSGCHNRSCANPAHLEVVTPSQNAARSNRGWPRPVSCPQGHLYSPENIRVVNAAGDLGCRECHRIRNRCANAVIKEARRLSGLTVRDYQAMYGNSVVAARKIVEALTRADA